MSEAGQVPPPKCKAILLCDQTILDAVTAKISVIGIFDRFNVPSLPNHTTPFKVFVQITDGIGSYDVTIEVHDLRQDKVLAKSGNAVRITFPERLHRNNLMIPMPPLPISHDGAYDLVVFANGSEIDRQQFTVHAPPGA